MTTKAKLKAEKKVSFTISAKVAKEFFGAAKGFFTEARLRITKTGIMYAMVDCANIFMARVELTKFESAHLPEEEIVFATEFSPLTRILSVAKPTDPITFELNKEKGKLTISTENTSMTLGSLDEKTLHKDPNIPKDLEKHLGIKAIISGERLLESLKLCNREKITLSIDDRGRLVSESESNNGDAEISIITYIGKVDGGESEEGEFRVMLDSGYMKDIIKNLAKKTISLKTNTDHPAWFVTDTDGLKIEYILAPRISVD